MWLASLLGVLPQNNLPGPPLRTHILQAHLPGNRNPYTKRFNHSYRSTNNSFGIKISLVDSFANDEINFRGDGDCSTIIFSSPSNSMFEFNSSDERLCVIQY